MLDPAPEAPPEPAPPATGLAAPVIAGLACPLAVELALELVSRLLGEDPERPSRTTAWLEIGAEHPLRIALCGTLAWIAWRAPLARPTEACEGRPPDTG